MELNYENIWQIYAPLFDKFTPQMSKELLSYSAKNCFGDLIDLGSGSGKLWQYLDFKKINTVAGIEKNSEMVKIALSKIETKKLKKISIYNLDLENFLTKNKYDFVVSLNVLYTQKDLKSHLILAKDLLKKKGNLFFQAQIILQIWENLRKL